MGVTMEQIKEYLKIDFSDDVGFLVELITVSDIYITKTVGMAFKDKPEYTPVAELVQKKIINDMYENRAVEVPADTKKSTIVTTIFEILEAAAWEDM